MAKALGKTDDYNYFAKRAQNWKNVYDPTTGFMRARKNGTLTEPFSPYMVDNNFTEANSWQYSFSVQQDIDGLMAMLGGKDKFETQLDALFHAKTETEGHQLDDIAGLVGQYAHGNEPSHHIAYLYNYAGKPEKAQAVVRYVIDSFYKNTPDGLIGNEDCGQMSAWYVMSAIGFYPVCHNRAEYELGMPLFDTVKIASPFTKELITKKEFTEALANAKGQHRVLRYHYFKDTIAYRFLDSHPEHDTSNEIVPNPFIIHASRVFRGEQDIEIQCADKNAEIYYSFNNLEFARYNHPLPVTQHASLKFYAQKGNVKTYVQEANFSRLPDDRTISLISPYVTQYNAGGPDALIDGLRGSLNWRKGNWQGFQQNFEAVIAFREQKEIHQISIGFLEDQGAWIFYPKEISYWASDDSSHWNLVKTVTTNKSGRDEKVKMENFILDKGFSAKYVKIVAQNFGKLPEWHESAGKDSYLFVDEVDIK